MADWRERSAEDREAARIERERRRAARAGRPLLQAPEPSVEPAVESAPPVPADESALPLPAGSAPPPPAASAPPPLSAETPQAEPAMPPEVPVQSPATVRQPEVAGVSGRPIKTLPSPPDPEFYSDEELEEPEVASGTRRVSRLGGQRPSKPRPAKRRGPATRRRSSWLGRIASLIALVLAAALVWFLIELFQPLGTSGHGQVTVTIKPHSSVSQIGDQLAAEKVIASSFFFVLRATLAGDRSDLRSGTYHLEQGMSYGAVLAALTKVPKAAKTSQLTISEGHTRQYVSALLRTQGIGGDYLAATRHSPLLDPRAYGAPKHVPSLEGFLFPDTFTLVDPIKASALADEQLKDFRQRFATVKLGAAHHLHLSDYEVLTVASLIEAEAAGDKDRPLVASVIYNRLRDHMMLQLDSTTRYATGNFARPLKVSQLNSPSPFNTRTHFGLPPTPIDSPGLASIRAAANPTHTRYLYFFAKPCTNQTVFAASYTGFLNLLARDRRPHCH